MPASEILRLEYACTPKELEEAIAQEAILSEKSVVMTSSQGRSELAWTTFAGFKETRWSFILWGDGSLWMLLPKRAFTSTAEQQRCSALLAAHLSRSRRFFG